MTDEHENFVHAEDAQVLEGGGETKISTLVLPHPDPSLAKKLRLFFVGKVGHGGQASVYAYRDGLGNYVAVKLRVVKKPVAKIIKVLAATGDAVGLVNGVTSIGDDDVDSVLADEFLHQHLARSEGIFPVFLHAQFDAMGGDGHVITKSAIVMPFAACDLQNIVSNHVDDRDAAYLRYGANRLSFGRQASTQLLRGLLNCDNRQVMNGDVKPGNVLLSGSVEQTAVGAWVARDCRVEVSDFGFAGMLEPGEESADVDGMSPKYACPELLQEAKASLKSMLFSWLLINFAMLYGAEAIEVEKDRAAHRATTKPSSSARAAALSPAVFVALVTGFDDLARLDAYLEKTSQLPDVPQVDPHNALERDSVRHFVRCVAHVGMAGLCGVDPRIAMEEVKAWPGFFNDAATKEETEWLSTQLWPRLLSKMRKTVRECDALAWESDAPAHAGLLALPMAPAPAPVAAKKTKARSASVATAPIFKLSDEATKENVPPKTRKKAAAVARGASAVPVVPSALPPSPAAAVRPSHRPRSPTAPPTAAATTAHRRDAPPEADVTALLHVALQRSSTEAALGEAKQRLVAYWGGQRRLKLKPRSGVITEPDISQKCARIGAFVWAALATCPTLKRDMFFQACGRIHDEIPPGLSTKAQCDAAFAVVRAAYNESHRASHPDAPSLSSSSSSIAIDSSARSFFLS